MAAGAIQAGLTQPARQLAGPADVIPGDADLDGSANDDDLSRLLANWTGDSGTIPEPATLTLLSRGAAAALCARRRR